MCGDCGCSVKPPVISLMNGEQEVHALRIHEGLLSKNDQWAQKNRETFHAKALLVLNIMSSPGSGKTSFIEQTGKRWRCPQAVGAIVGDLATDNDATRLNAAGVKAIQIRTGTACHLEADAIAQSLLPLHLQDLDILFIENVGNLVCPAAYDLGEALRVVLLSVTEGEDKPLKYPTAFQSADIVIVTKTDIADAVDFDRTTAIANISRMAPQAQLLEVSARNGAGMTHWINLLQTKVYPPQRQPIQTAGT